MPTIKEEEIFIAGADESEDVMTEGIKKLFGGFCDPTSEKKELFCDPSTVFSFLDDDVKDRSLEAEEAKEAPKKTFTKRRIGITSVVFVAVFAVFVGVSAFRTGQELPVEPVVPAKRGGYKKK